MTKSTRERLSVTVSAENLQIVRDTAADLNTNLSTAVNMIIDEWQELSNLSALDARATNNRLTELTERITRLEQINISLCRAVRGLVQIEHSRANAVEDKRTA